MKNKSLKAHPLSLRLWIEFTKGFLILFILFTLINSILLNQWQEFRIYEILEESAYGLDELEPHHHSKTISFTIFKDADKPKITLPENSEILLHSEEDKIALTSIGEKIFEDNLSVNKGKYGYFGRTLYYYSLRIAPNTYEVYVEKVESPWLYYIQFFMIFILLLIIIFLFCLRIAKKLAAPFEQLSLYTVEIGNKNWDYQMNKTNTIEVNELINSLAKMQKQLESTEAKEKTLLQNISHDLKTPVMIIEGYIGAKKDGKFKEDDLAYLEIIESETLRLKRKIGQLLQINTLEHVLNDESLWEIISINRLFSQLVKKYQHLNQDLIWSLEMEPLEILGEIAPIIIAIENILDNQIKYAEHKVNIHITQEGEIYIINDGPLLTLENPADIFSTYRTDLKGDFGLGLAITKKTIEHYNGEINANNLPNGVLFAIKFPPIKD